MKKGLMIFGQNSKKSDIVIRERERELILPLGFSKKTEYRIFLNKTPLGKKINFVVKKLITVAKAFAFRSARLPGERHYFESALTPLDLTMWVPFDNRSFSQ